MLAITETLASAAGITWAFCDTDSMALAKPEGMSETEFIKRALEVQDWFTTLNPYEIKGPLLKVEDINYGVHSSNAQRDLIPLFCWAVSAKRYALFNLDDKCKPRIRKASANGLGHLLPPYGSKILRNKDLPPELKETELQQWQYDLWILIIEAALGHRYQQLPLAELGKFICPGVSRYTATTPGLLRWFDDYNAGRPYCEQVKPFNFLLAFQAKLDLRRITPERLCELAPVAPYDSDYEKALRHCFDRKTGKLVPVTELKSYKELLNQYHLHPEAKFTNGDYLDSGFTGRRHVMALGIEHIGKEANRLEEQWYAGASDDTQIHYGIGPDDLGSLVEEFRKFSRQIGRREFAEAARISPGHLDRILKGRAMPSDKIIVKLRKAVRILAAK